MKRSRQSLFLLTPLVLIAAGSARAQDAGSAAPAATTAPAASTAAPPASTAPPPASTPPPTSAPAAAPPASTGDGAQKKDGFVFETHVYAQLLNFGIGVGGTLNLPLVTGGIFGGYKLDRLIFGLGFDFSSYDAPGSGGAQIVMRWAPGLRYDLVRSSDEKVALFGQFDLSFGHNFGTPQSNEIIGADLGLGVRYWVHPQFAFAGVGGWNGNWNLTQSPDSSTVLQGIFAGMQLLGVF